MYYNELKDSDFSIIMDDDPYKASKELQIKKWCGAFWDLFDNRGEPKLPFLLDVLSDKECWEKSDTIHGIKLNRRIAAKKMVELRSWNGLSNPLNDFKRYRVACWCCLEEDIVALFEHFKEEKKIKDGDAASLKELVKSASTDLMMEYWSHVVSGYGPELKLKSRHLYIYGLDCALSMLSKRLEAVEFFYNRIKSLPEDELSAQQKARIFMKTAVRAAGTNCNIYPEIFEFCFSQISPDKYPELLKRDFAKHRYYGSFSALRGMRCFDHFQRLFDCLKPCDISEDSYHLWLKCIDIKDCSGHYADAGIKLFMHMWVKEGFDSHRAFVLRKEITVMSSIPETGLLIPFIHGSYMEPVWALLDKASHDQIKEFMGSRQADYIRSVLKERGDENSLNKFLSYGASTVEEFENPSANVRQVNLRRRMKLNTLK